MARPSSTFGNLSDTTVTQNTPDVKNSICNRNETDTQSTLRAQAEETVRAVMESYPATVQEARITAVAQSLRETGETALADEVIRVWQDAGGENVVYYAKKAAENAAETEDAGYGREGETGGVRVREGRERNDGQSAGGSSGAMEGSAGRTAAADARRNVSAGQSKSRRVVKLNVKEYRNIETKLYENRVIEIEKLTVIAGESGIKPVSTSGTVSFKPILEVLIDLSRDNKRNVIKSMIQQ